MTSVPEAAEQSLRLLAIETSSAVATVALARGTQISEAAVDAPRLQSERLVPLIDELLDAAGWSLADLDAIVFGRGPGSFTGLRVAAAIAQGLSLAAGRPVVAVSSLRAAAQRAARELGAERIWVCTDARMGEVYSAAFVQDVPLVRRVDEERLLAPDALQAPRDPAWRGAWHAVGDGWAAHRDAVASLLGTAAAVVGDLRPAARDLLPQAAAELMAGRLLSPDEALPIYLRNEDAWRRRGI